MPTYHLEDHPLIDIAFNLSDHMYKGIYNFSPPAKHPEDHLTVLKRAWQHFHVKGFMLTSVSEESARESLALVREYGCLDLVGEHKSQQESKVPSKHLRCTVGVHPTHCCEFLKNPPKDSDEEQSEPEFTIDEEYASAHLHKLLDLALQGQKEGIVAAVGEIGLDYARTKFCPKEVQQQFFVRQLEELGGKTGLPFFLHNRDSFEDMYSILKDHSDLISQNGAVIHSFDGTVEEMLAFCKLDNVFIGINGCSLKTEENLAVVKALPLERLMLETDAPWCQVKNSYAGSKFIKTSIPTINRKDKYTLECGKMVKGRNEPCTLIQVAEIVAGVQETQVELVAKYAYANTVKLFFKHLRVSS